MLFITLIIKIFANSKENKLLEKINEKNSLETCRDDLTISLIGFYNLSVKIGCKITAILNEGSVRMFFFYDNFDQNDFDITIDDEIVKPEVNHSKGFVIDGNSQITIKFLKYFESEKNVNIWLLPSHLCTGTTLYAYNYYSIDLRIPYTSSELCIFSPLFDSLKNKYNIEFGINSNSNDHKSSLFTESYYQPKIVAKNSNIIKTKVKGSYLIEFRYDTKLTNYSQISPYDQDNYYSNFIFYKRVTDQIEQKGTKNNIWSASKCNKSHGCIASLFPPLEVHFNKPTKIMNIEITVFCVGATVFVVIAIIIFILYKRKYNIIFNNEQLDELLILDNPLTIDSNMKNNETETSNKTDQLTIKTPENI